MVQGKVFPKGFGRTTKTMRLMLKASLVPFLAIALLTLVFWGVTHFGSETQKARNWIVPVFPLVTFTFIGTLMYLRARKLAFLEWTETASGIRIFENRAGVQQTLIDIPFTKISQVRAAHGVFVIVFGSLNEGPRRYRILPENIFIFHEPLDESPLRTVLRANTTARFIDA